MQQRLSPTPQRSKMSSWRPAPVQAKRLPGAPVAVPRHGPGASIGQALAAARGGGAALPGTIQAAMGQALSADFGAVRVHDDLRADRFARGLGAVAVAAGSDLFFRHGAYRPETARGRALIGHELTHVVQQHSGRARASGDATAVVKDPALESEADRLGHRAAAWPAASVASPLSRTAEPGSSAAVQLSRGGHVGRTIQCMDESALGSTTDSWQFAALPAIGAAAIGGALYKIYRDLSNDQVIRDRDYTQPLSNIPRDAWDRLREAPHIEAIPSLGKIKVAEASALKALAEEAVKKRNTLMAETRDKISYPGLLLSWFMKQKGLSYEQIEAKVQKKFPGNQRRVYKEIIYSASRSNANLSKKFLNTVAGRPS